MDVVEQQHQRLDRGQPFEQLTHGAMGPVALVNQRRPSVAGQPSERRKDTTELDANVVVQLRQATRLEAPDELLDRVDEHPERQIAFQLGRRTRQHQQPPPLSPSRQLAEQPRLADTRLAHHGQRRTLPIVEQIQGVIHGAKLLHAANEVFAEHHHHLPARRG